MSDPYDPLDHLPDPAKRFKVLGYTRGVELYIEVMDDVTKQGVVMDFLSALRVAADINLEAARILEVVTSQMEQGTIPQFEKLIGEWGHHGEGTADKN